MITEKLYHSDAYVTEFSATILGLAEDGGLVLDRTAFYPESGGQAHDLGWIGDMPVLSVADLGDVVSHHLDGGFKVGATVTCRLDWERRFDLMQQHSGQHLLSAVLENSFGWKTASVHMSVETCTVELEAGDLTATALVEAELEANRWVQKNLPITAAFHDSSAGLDLRKPTDRKGPIRVVRISGLDLSACGGTHVKASGEIGLVLLGKTEKIRGNTRLEFVCGLRALRYARERISWLVAAAGVFQNSADSVPELAARQRDEAVRLSKENRDLGMKLAEREGAEARIQFGAPGAPGVVDASKPTDLPGGKGCLCALRSVRGGIDDRARSFANGFCTTAGTVLLTVCQDTGAFLLCSSKADGIDAKAWFQANALPLGAKGGGSPQVVNGRLPDAALAETLANSLPDSPVSVA